MPRIKHKTSALAIALILLILVAYNIFQQQQHAREMERDAIKNIVSSIGPRNLSASALVLPDESTVLLQPAKSCEVHGLTLLQIESWSQLLIP